MKLGGRDADLGAEPQAEAVREGRRAIDADGRRVHASQPRLAVCVVVGDDDLGVVRSEAPDVLDSLRQLLPNAVYLHLACHAQFDPDQPLNSRLELSPQTNWLLQDILDFDRLDGVRLAVLSACQTGLADFRRVPDEVIGFIKTKGLYL